MGLESEKKRIAGTEREKKRSGPSVTSGTSGRDGADTVGAR